MLFALWCMHAEFPHRVGKASETLYRLYNLLAHCDAQVDLTLSPLGVGTIPGAIPGTGAIRVDC